MAKFDIDVMARILLALLQEPMGRTALFMRTKLNYPRFMQYLEYLKERGLVVERDGAVRLTERGLEVAKGAGQGPQRTAVMYRQYIRFITPDPAGPHEGPPSGGRAHHRHGRPGAPHV
jgi:predicted transcriptional regulator